MRIDDGVGIQQRLERCSPPFRYSMRACRAWLRAVVRGHRSGRGDTPLRAARLPRWKLLICLISQQSLGTDFSSTHGRRSHLPGTSAMRTDRRKHFVPVPFDSVAR